MPKVSGLAAATLPLTGAETVYVVQGGNSRQTDVTGIVASKLNASGAAPMFACRAWVNFNGTGVVAIRASGNVSSITDNGVGDYTVNFTTALPDANYALVGINTVASDGTKGAVCLAAGYDNPATLKSTTQVRIRTGQANAVTFVDFQEINLAIFR